VCFDGRIRALDDGHDHESDDDEAETYGEHMKAGHDQSHQKKNTEHGETKKKPKKRWAIKPIEKAKYPLRKPKPFDWYPTYAEFHKIIFKVLVEKFGVSFDFRN